ncbi:MAG: FecR domain-containing protein [Anaerolineae bacterium]|nr:FecR domain-containing protein [Anaerolineae bacterium]
MMRSGNRKRRGGIGWALVVLVVVPLIAVQVRHTVQARQGDDLATLDPVQGVVQHRALEAEPDAWETITHRRLVADGDSIQTDSVGLAVLTFFEGIQSEIRPNSLVQVQQVTVDGDAGIDVSLDVLIGSTLNSVEQAADIQARYEIHTPTAVIAVRGTVFWADVSPGGETRVNTVNGTVWVTAILPDGRFGETAVVEAGMQAAVSTAGVIEVTAIPDDAREKVPDVPLAPSTCGDGMCSIVEQATCSLDCTEVPDCGNGVCDLPLEGPATCPVDCAPEPLEPLPQPYQGASIVEVAFCTEWRDSITAGGVVTFQHGIGFYEDLAESVAERAGLSAVFTLDGAALGPVYYEGLTIHGGGWYGDRGRVDWTATPGTHTVISHWTNEGEGLPGDTCTFTVR